MGHGVSASALEMPQQSGKSGRKLRVRTHRMVLYRETSGRYDTSGIYIGPVDVSEMSVKGKRSGSAFVDSEKAI